MEEMFNDAGSFNQSVASWDVSRVTTMEGMFRCHPTSLFTFTHQLARSGATTAVPHSRSLSLCARVVWQVLLELEHVDQF